MAFNRSYSNFSRFRNRKRFQRRNRFNKFRGKKGRIIGAKRVVNPMLLTSKNMTRPSLNLPITPRYLTKFSYGFAGRTNIGTTNGSAGRFVLKFNSPYLPGNYTATANYRFIDSNNLSSVLITPTSSLATLSPAGYDQLCSVNFYRRHRVGASMVKVTCQPTNEADNILLCIVPIPANLASNLASFDSAAVRAQNLPYSKERVCTLNNYVKGNTIKHYLDVPSLEGKRKEQVLDDDEYQAQYNADPTQINLWLVTWQTMSGANLTGDLNFDIQAVYYTELSELTYPTQGTP